MSSVQHHEPLRHACAFCGAARHTRDAILSHGRLAPACQTCKATIGPRRGRPSKKSPQTPAPALQVQGRPRHQCGFCGQDRPGGLTIIFKGLTISSCQACKAKYGGRVGRPKKAKHRHEPMKLIACAECTAPRYLALNTYNPLCVECYLETRHDQSVTGYNRYDAGKIMAGRRRDNCAYCGGPRADLFRIKVKGQHHPVCESCKTHHGRPVGRRAPKSYRTPSRHLRAGETFAWRGDKVTVIKDTIPGSSRAHVDVAVAASMRVYRRTMAIRDLLECPPATQTQTEERAAEC